MKTATAWSLVIVMLTLAVVCTSVCADDPPAPPAAGNGSIKGLVTYGGPIAKISIALDGPIKKTTKTDEKGQFVFPDLPPGEYTIEAKGVAKNNLHKGSAKVIVPDPPKEPVAITIKLS